MDEKLQEKMIALCPVDHVVVRARSLAASSAYYSALLPLIGFGQIGASRWRTAAGFTVDVQEADPQTADYDRFAPGVNHLGFRAPDPAALEAVRDAMRSAGFPAPDIQRFPGALALFMRDPDGLRFEISFEEQVA